MAPACLTSGVIVIIQCQDQHSYYHNSTMLVKMYEEYIFTYLFDWLMVILNVYSKKEITLYWMIDNHYYDLF